MNSRVGLVRCEHCNRQFNPHSAARHIPWCEKQQADRRKHKLSVEKRQALERYRWRISYRPSNQIAAYQQPIGGYSDPEDRGRVSLADLGNKKVSKRSSVNSSATLSSLSASSTTSIGTSVASTNEVRSLRNTSNHNYRSQPPRRQQPQRQQAPNRLPPVGNLKRSISSVTLTKQRGVLGSPSGVGWAPNEPARSDTSSINQNRAKSVSDLSNMSEIVETLAKRMDEIYVQNQLLLASLSRSQHGQASQSRSRDKGSGEHDRLHTDGGDLGMLDDGEGSKCHHCRTSCFEEANYCHRCGCKVRAASGSCSISSPEQH